MQCEQCCEGRSPGKKLWGPHQAGASEEEALELHLEGWMGIAHGKSRGNSMERWVDVREFCVIKGQKGVGLAG